MNNKEISDLKLQGFLKQKQDGYFSVRIISCAGNMTSNQINKISKIAEEYGKGYMGFTTRLTVEIPWIKEEDIAKVKKELSDAGLKTGGTGKKVRPLMACKGTVCVHGIIDTQGLCIKLKNKYSDDTLYPAKFKIGIVGCPNNCAKASLNDLGFMGQSIVKINEDKCKGCMLCAAVCKTNALIKENGKAYIDRDKCTNCGECANNCPQNAIEVVEKGVTAFLGGKFGRTYRIGNRMDNIMSEDEAIEFTGKALTYFKENAKPGERFGNFIERLGWNKVKKDLEKNK